VLMLVATFISFFAVQAIVTQHHVQHGLGYPGALRTVIGAALYMTVLAVMCTGIGGILRNTAGGIATFVALLFVLPGISAILPSSLNNDISPYLPLNAGTTVATHAPGPGSLSVWGGFALFCGYAAVAVALAAYSLIRRDA
jgi:ABC-2 type transport system permease protein